MLSGAIIGTILIITQHGATTAGVDSHSILLGVAFSIGSAFLYAGFSMISGRISIALGAGPATACLTVVAAAVMSLYALCRPLRKFPRWVEPTLSDTINSLFTEKLSEQQSNQSHAPLDRARWQGVRR